MPGDRQEARLKDNLTLAQARWNVLAQQVVMMDFDRDPSDAYVGHVDSWAGYRTPRDRLLKHVEDQKVRNLVVLTGDEHVHYAGEIHRDGRKPGTSSTYF